MEEFVCIDSANSQLSVNGDILIADPELEILSDMTFGEGTGGEYTDALANNNYRSFWKGIRTTKNENANKGWWYTDSAFTTSSDEFSLGLETITSDGTSQAVYAPRQNKSAFLGGAYKFSFFYKPSNITALNPIGFKIEYVNSTDSVIGEFFIDYAGEGMKSGKWDKFEYMQSDMWTGVDWEPGGSQSSTSYLDFSIRLNGCTATLLYPKLIIYGENF